MQGSRTGGAGKVHADYNVNYLSKQVAYNGEATQIPVGSIVSLRTSNNGAALKAFLAMPTNAAHWDGIWAVVRGGLAQAAARLLGWWFSGRSWTWTPVQRSWMLPSMSIRGLLGCLPWLRQQVLRLLARSSASAHRPRTSRTRCSLTPSPCGTPETQPRFRMWRR